MRRTAFIALDEPAVFTGNPRLFPVLGFGTFAAHRRDTDLLQILEQVHEREKCLEHGHFRLADRWHVILCCHWNPRLEKGPSGLPGKPRRKTQKTPCVKHGLTEALNRVSFSGSYRMFREEGTFKIHEKKAIGR